MKSEVRWSDVIRDKLDYLPPDVVEMFVSEMDRRIAMSNAANNGVVIEYIAGDYAFSGWVRFERLESSASGAVFFVQDGGCYLV